MKIELLKNRSFAQQLTIYLLVVLILVFFFISLTLTNSLEQFIDHNAYSQSQMVSANVLNIFKKQINQIEEIPQRVHLLQGDISEKNIFSLPAKVLHSFPQLVGCSVYCSSCHSHTGSPLAIEAYRQNGKIKTIQQKDTDVSFHNFVKEFVKNNKSYWHYSNVNHTKTIAYYYPVHDANTHNFIIFKIDFLVKTITDIICDYKLFKSGYLFIIDDKGRYVAHPNPEMLSQTVFAEIQNTRQQPNDVIRKMLHGNTGIGSIHINRVKHYIYYTPVHHMNWRLGVICPYSEVMNSSSKLYILLSFCMILGLLFLFLGVSSIVYRLTNPLKQLAHATQEISNGKFDTPLPAIEASNEIKELYDSFTNMQISLKNYIEQIKISIAEKEKLSVEMQFAQKIQQQFLPKASCFSDTLEFYAALKQSHEVGGDLYDYLIIDDKLYFIIGDVSGKGTPAAFYMVWIIKLFRYIAATHHSTAKICNVINRHTCDNSDNCMYVTLFTGILDLKSGQLTFTNAGHLYPIAISPDHDIRLMEKYPDVPIGVLENYSYSEYYANITPDTTLLFYTDGITDLENEKGEFYGHQNLIKCLREMGPQTPQNIIHYIVEKLKDYRGNAPQSDDMTLLSILFKKNGPS